MTLDAIRARAGTHPGVSVDSELRAVIDALEAWDGTGAPPDIPDHLTLWWWYDRAARDRTALLAVAEAAAAVVREDRGILCFEIPGRACEWCEWCRLRGALKALEDAP